MSNNRPTQPGSTPTPGGAGKGQSSAAGNRSTPGQRPATPGARPGATPGARPGTRPATSAAGARPRPGSRYQPKKQGFRLRPLDIGLILIGVAVVAVIAYSVIAGASGGSGGGSGSAPASGFGLKGTPVTGNVVTVPSVDGGGGQMEVLANGSVAPDFTLPGNDGKTYTLSEFKGKTVLLEFMAPWCPHCQADAPEFNQVYNTLKDKNFTAFGVSATPYDHNKTGPISMNDLTWFRDQFQVPYVLLFDQPVNQVPLVANAYHINFYPTLYIVGPDGKIANYMLSGGTEDTALTSDRVIAEVSKYIK